MPWSVRRPSCGVGTHTQVVVITDAAKHQMQVSIDGRTVFVSTPANERTDRH